jgi:hypothetical protein
MVGDPWSLRQIGVYQKYDGTNDRSVWIFISASDIPHQAVDAVRQSSTFHDERRQGAIVALHAVLLETAALEWRTYLESLNAQIELLVRLADLSTIYFGADRARMRKHVFLVSDRHTKPTTLWPSPTASACSASARSSYKLATS